MINVSFNRIKKRITAICMVLILIAMWCPQGFTIVKGAEMELVEPKIEVDEAGMSWYQIGSVEELYWYANRVNDTTLTKLERASMNGKLTNDIVVNSQVLVQGALNSNTSSFTPWVPIGCKETGTYCPSYFYGTFDGQGYSISGLYMNSTSDYDFAGLFGAASGVKIGDTYYVGTIRNVHVTDSYLNGGEIQLGGILGIGEPAKVSGCSYTGILEGKGTITGGLVGTNNNNTTKSVQGLVEDSWTNATVVGINGAGGLVGQNVGIIRNCYASGSVSGQPISSVHGFVGGLVGSNAGVYENVNSSVGLCINSYSTATVSSAKEGDAIGAIAGRASGGYFINCYGSGYAIKGIGEIPSTGKDDTTQMTKNNYYYTSNDSSGATVGAYRTMAYNCYYLGATDTDSSYEGLMIRTKESFASGVIAYNLNHQFNNTMIYQMFGKSVTAAYGQQIGRDDTPVFFNRDKTNEVFKLEYYGDYEGIDYVNDTAVLPVCQESGYYYQFISDATDTNFEGTGILADDKIKVVKISAIPEKNQQGIYEIYCGAQLQWFSQYVNGNASASLEDTTNTDGGGNVSPEDPTKASAILMADIDMQELTMDPIGSANLEEGDLTTQYENAYKGTFYGNYHVISNLSIATYGNQVALFGAAYGAVITDLGLEQASFQGNRYVAGLVGAAAGVRINHCYVQGRIVASGDYLGGLVGFSDIIETGSHEDYPSLSLGTVGYRSYVSALMQKGSTKMAGGITGGVTSKTLNLEDSTAQVYYEDCYYDSTKAAVLGAMVNGSLEGSSLNSGNTFAKNTAVEAQDAETQRVVGRTTVQFDSGKVTWELQHANAMASLGKAQMWVQDVTTENKERIPAFANKYKDTSKVEVFRYGAYNGTEFYEYNGKTYEFYGNTGAVLEIPEGYPEYKEEGERQYFVGWTAADPTLGESGKTLVTESIIVTEDTYLYAFYDSTGRLLVSVNKDMITYEYGRAYEGQETILATAVCSMYPVGTGVNYQWRYMSEDEYYQGGDLKERSRILTGETKAEYGPAVNLSVGTHYVYCQVTADNGLEQTSPLVTITVTKGTLKESDFQQIPEQYYTGSAIKPSLAIADGAYVSPSDYTVEYSDNSNVSTESKTAKAVVTATNGGNYQGSVTLSFTIGYLTADRTMYEIVGEADKEGYYKDSVTIVPKEGYLMGSRLTGNFTTEGVTYTAVSEYEIYHLNFYLRQENTGAYTNLVSVSVRVKKVTSTLPNTSEETVGNQTTETTQAAVGTTQTPSTTQAAAPITHIPITLEPEGPEANENVAIKDKYGETTYYFDGYDMPQKGSFYNIGNYKYRVVSSTLAGGTVELYKVINKKITVSNVPIYVTINGFNYLVVGIHKKAFAKLKYLTSVKGGDNVTVLGKKTFYKCNKLKEVTIGKRVKKVGAQCFYGCSKLKRVKIRSKVLKSVGKKAFAKTGPKIILKTNEKQWKKYKKLMIAGGCHKKISKK